MRRVSPPAFRAMTLCVSLALAMSAQQQPQSPGLPEAPLPSAATSVILPPRVVAGQVATLAILDENGRLVPGAEVIFEGGASVKTDAGGRAEFVVPEKVTVLLASLPGGELNAASSVHTAPVKAHEAIQISEVPAVVSAQDHFSILGTGLTGDASKMSATLAGHRAAVLAASPLSLVLLPGRGTPTGASQLVLEVAGRPPVAVPVQIVRLELSSEKRHFAAGVKGTVVVRAIGTDQRVVVEVRNLSKDVLALPRGDIQRVATRGGAENVAIVELIGLREGDFSLSVRLLPRAAGLPDVETARLYLIAARDIAAKDWVDDVDRLVQRIERDPDRPGWVRTELQKLLSKEVSGELRARLEAALRSLER